MSVGLLAATALPAALGAVGGGLLALWRAPTTLFTSLAFGFAGGALLGSISLEMIPSALELGSRRVVAAGFALGFVSLYAFDLFVHRWRIAGLVADQRKSVERFHAQRPPRGGEATVLAGGTSAEDFIEGIVIGVGAAVESRLAVLVAIAIALDNVAEGLSIGELIRSESDGTVAHARRILSWTGVMAAAVLGAAIIGRYALAELDDQALAFLLAAGGSGMLYLTVTDLIPEGQVRHYQQSAAVAIAAGFLVMLGLSSSA